MKGRRGLKDAQGIRLFTPPNANGVDARRHVRGPREGWKRLDGLGANERGKMIGITDGKSEVRKYEGRRALRGEEGDQCVYATVSERWFGGNLPTVL